MLAGLRSTGRPGTSSELRVVAAKAIRCRSPAVQFYNAHQPATSGDACRPSSASLTRYWVIIVHSSSHLRDSMALKQRLGSCTHSVVGGRKMRARLQASRFSRSASFCLIWDAWLSTSVQDPEMCISRGHASSAVTHSTPRVGLEHGSVSRGPVRLTGGRGARWRDHHRYSAEALVAGHGRSSDSHQQSPPGDPLEGLS